MSTLFWEVNMKSIVNQQPASDYYIGLDVGTNSIGWAVTDTQYNIKKYKGNAMWGVRLFEEAQPAASRRQFRIIRRLNSRRHRRLEWLELLFDEQISKIDPCFFARLRQSSLEKSDRSINFDYPLFNGEDFTDKDYYKKYPTAYHLRKELIESDATHDIRLVFLALHHIIKSRGHFLFDMELSDEYKTVDTLLNELKLQMEEDFGTEIDFTDKDEFIAVLTRQNVGITAKKNALKGLVAVNGEADRLDAISVVGLLAGATVKFSDLFCEEELKKAEKNSLSLAKDFSADLNAIEEAVGSDRLEFILFAKEVFDSAKLAQMLGQHEYICEAKIEQYDINKSDLGRLKEYVKQHRPEKYKEIFSEKRDKLNNFAAYGKKTLSSGDYSCSQEDFCKYILKALPEMEADEAFADIYQKLKNGDFLPKLKSSDNSVIPYQLHLKELVKILDNASKYLDFLEQKDDDGITVKEKIISIFKFKIPYYVGPLNTKSKNAWVVRTDEKIYPWNFEKVVDIEKSSENFILNLISKCRYTGDDVLPKESLLYSEYCVLNEINPIAVNGQKIPVNIKSEIYTELFLKTNSKVTKKTVKNFLLKKGYIKAEDEISGIDDTVKSRLKSYHNLSKIFSVEEKYDMAEDIIRAITIFGDDKKLLKNWLKSKYPDLEKAQADSICRLKYKDWGRLSKTLLTCIYTPDENGVAQSIMDMLRSINNNLMQLLSSDYMFSQNAAAYRSEKYGTGESLAEMIEEMYVSPSVKRSLLQTVKVVEEIVGTQKAAPKKIMKEVARDKNDQNAKARTVTRKGKLMELYKSCKKDHPDLYAALEAADESDLRKDALYLYYTQFGKCMYSGEHIDLEKLSTDYDIDHIFPQSRIKDDSIDNRVLVLRKFNEQKSNVYPLNAQLQDNMHSFWYMLKEKGLISSKKYERLVRQTPLTDSELSSFVQRQLVETRQSTKALAQVLGRIFDGQKTKIVYSKAGNVSDFRQQFKIIKCRDVNDLHHAKDAYLNVVVGNVYDTKFTENFFKNIRSEKYSLNTVFKADVNNAWDKDRSIGVVKATVGKNNILLSRKAYETKGQLYDVQIKSAGKGQLEGKQGRSIEKYGGYNSLKGAYFCLVEHTEKKGRTRTVLPVYIYKKELYEKDPVAYCTEILGLKEPKIICPRILTDSLLKIDGKELFITGRSDVRLLFKHNYQLSISAADEKYIKEISKYVSRSQMEKAEDGIKLAPNSEISKERNAGLYDLFLQKLQTPVYNRLFSGLYEPLCHDKEAFCGLPLIEQCRLLLEILKLFKCDRQLSDLSKLGESAKSGQIRFSNSLAKVKSAFLIHTSVTGLYRHKQNLLK